MKPIEVKALKRYKIWLKYEDGTKGEIDLNHLTGQGVFKYWDEGNNFFNVYIDKESNAIAWSDELDICPDNIYFKLKKLDPVKELIKQPA